MKKIVSIAAWLFPGQCIKALFVKSVSGRQNFPKRNFILASNHLSHIDWLIDGAIVTPRRFTFIGQVDKMTGAKGFMRDLIYWWAEVIPVNRNDREAKKKTLETAIAMIKKGYCLIMYPEGTRSRDGQLHVFKPGVGKLHLESGAPIVPAAHIGTYELMPSGAKLKAEKSVRVIVGKPLDFPKEREAAAKMDKSAPEYYKICADVAKKTEEAVRKLLKEQN